MNGVSVNLLICGTVLFLGWTEFWSWAAGQTSFVSNTRHSNGTNERSFASAERVDVQKTCRVNTRARLKSFYEVLHVSIKLIVVSIHWCIVTVEIAWRFQWIGFCFYRNLNYWQVLWKDDDTCTCMRGIVSPAFKCSLCSLYVDDFSTGYNLFCKEQVKHIEGVPKISYCIVLAQRWKALTENERKEYSARCKEVWTLKVFGMTVKVYEHKYLFVSVEEAVREWLEILSNCELDKKILVWNWCELTDNVIKAFVLQMEEEKQTQDQSDARKVRNKQYFYFDAWSLSGLNSCCLSCKMRGRFEALHFVFRSLGTEPTGAERVSNTKSQRKHAWIW